MNSKYIYRVFFTFICILFFNSVYSYNICKPIKIPAYKAKPSQTSGYRESQSTEIFDYQTKNTQLADLNRSTPSDISTTKNTTNYTIANKSETKDFSKSTASYNYSLQGYTDGNSAKSTDSKNNFSLKYFESSQNTNIYKAATNTTVTSDRKPFDELNTSTTHVMNRAPGDPPPDPGNIPVGDGTYLLILSAILYSIYKFQFSRK